MMLFDEEPNMFFLSDHRGMKGGWVQICRVMSSRQLFNVPCRIISGGVASSRMMSSCLGARRTWFPSSVVDAGFRFR